jgi:hypothetical protein
MHKIIYGDNQFFGVNHISDEKSRAQAIRFKQDQSILQMLNIARGEGLHTFMCTTHERISNITKTIRESPGKYENFQIYPCLPYAHKYANAVTELGIAGTIKQYMPGNIIGSVLKGGVAVISKDYISIMELMIDAELKAFKGINTPVIFLQNVITDLLLGLGMKDIFKAYHNYIIKKFNAEPGYITMNMPKLLETLESVGIKNPIICSSINIDGFRMSGGKKLYEHTLKTRRLRAIAMQVLSGGATPVEEALRYVCELPNIESILFGASTKENIRHTVSTIRKYDIMNEVPVF